MSAIKHLGAKTVYIPRNSSTDKRRNFAIVGFSSQEDQQKALKAHVELFGLTTWWSTKDNQKLNKKRNSYTRRYSNKQESHIEENKNTFLDTTSDSESIVSSNNTYSNYNKHHEQESFQESKQRKKQKQTKGKRTQDLGNSISSITSVLQNIAERLSKLEMRERKGKGVPHS